VAKP